MKKYIDAVKTLCCLKAFPTIVISIPAYILVAWVLITGKTDTVIGYISYVISAYAMVITCTLVYRITVKIKRKIQGISLYQKYRSDLVFRTKVSLYPGVLVQLMYVLIKLGYGLYFKSFWFISLAFYYALLGAMRFYLLKYVKQQSVGTDYLAELKKARLCGILLIQMDIVLAVLVVFMVVWNRGYEYPGLFIYAMAAYSFYAITMAIVNMIKYRKYGSPVINAAKILNVTAAMVSILSLETAMLSTFGSANGEFFRKMMIGLTGLGVCAVVLTMAVLMILHTSQELLSYDSN